MADATCSIDGCEKSVRGRGWCNRHYSRWRRHGTPTAGGPDRIVGDPAARFWSYVRSDDADACWPWTGATIGTGYGHFWDGEREVLAHRHSYELAHGGPIPAGETVDHLCHGADETCAGGLTCPHRLCCNPAHMELCGAVENMLRGQGPSAVNARKTHCIRGHEFNAANTYVRPNGYRTCRRCIRPRTRKRRIDTAPYLTD